VIGGSYQKRYITESKETDKENKNEAATLIRKQLIHFRYNQTMNARFDRPIIFVCIERTWNYHLSGSNFLVDKHINYCQDVGLILLH
jgi:putative NADH-flavin reductase